MTCWNDYDNFLTEALIPELLSIFAANKKKKINTQLSSFKYLLAGTTKFIVWEIIF